MSNNFIYAAFFLLILLSACKPNAKEQLNLTGNWQASKMLIADSILDVKYDLIKLRVLPHSRYNFTNNLSQTESGIFEINYSLLILRDTTKTKITERAIHILKLTGDSLLLRQNYRGKDARLLMLRAK